MSRQDEHKSTNPNPAKKFLGWKSDNKDFAFWDKETEKEVHIPIPFAFLVLKDLSTVGGWHDASESGIFGNEVKFLGTEPITARAYKANSPIATGLYKEIKTTVTDAGGHYVKSLYVMLKDGSIVNIKLKGSAVKEWSDFTSKGKERMSDEWVSAYSFEARKKGKINYSVPLFKYDGSLSPKDNASADLAYNEVQNYFNDKLKGSNEAEAINNIDTEHEEIPNRAPIDTTIPPDLEL